MKTLPYKEGTWFAVPLPGGAYVVGVVARMGRRGVTLGYFFGPKRNAVPALDEVEELRPEQAILVKIFGDLGLIDASWPIIGWSAIWDRRRWPMPSFGRFDPATGHAFRVEYSEETLLDPVRETEIPFEQEERLPRWALSGAGAIELVLARLLSE